MHKRSLSLSRTHGLYYSFYLRKHAYLQPWGTTVESLGTGWLFKKAPVRRAVTERGWATQRLPSRKKKKMDKHARVFPSHVFKCRRNSGQHERKVCVIII